METPNHQVAGQGKLVLLIGRTSIKGMTLIGLSEMVKMRGRRRSNYLLQRNATVVTKDPAMGRIISDIIRARAIGSSRTIEIGLLFRTNQDIAGP